VEKTLMIRIGVDFGGTKIEAAALNSSGEFLARLRVPNPGRYDAALQAIAGLVRQIEQEVGQRSSVGVGAPGSVAPETGVVRNSNAVWLNGQPFRHDLEAALGRPVRLANDANCMVLSEATDGAAQGFANVFGIIIGTGCGGGVVINGQLVAGANGIAGEIGHSSLPWPRGEELALASCWCGQQSCIEDWVSGTGLARDYLASTGTASHGEAIVAAWRAGDAGASACFTRYVDRLGRSLAMVCNLLDPDVIVFGGGMSNVAELYDLLPAAIGAHVFHDAWKARLVQAKWGDSSGVRGAARLW
jgi:fructokinase